MSFALLQILRICVEYLIFLSQETSDELIEQFYARTSGMPRYCADNHHRTANTSHGIQNYCSIP